MAVGESVSNSTLWDTRRPPRGNIALPSMGALLGGPYDTPTTCGTKMESMNKEFEVKESSTPGDSGKGSKEGSSQGELLCLEALQGETRQNPKM
jgi:hypothetical protein